jgi:hypothetical protein
MMLNWAVLTLTEFGSLLYAWVRIEADRSYYEAAHFL